MDKCYFCGSEGSRYGSCADKMLLCEICGSISLDGNADTQKHYDEDCFK